MKTNNNGKRNKSEIRNMMNMKRTRVFLLSMVIIFILLVIRIFWLQFVNGAWLKEQATQRQTTTRTIAASRGTIFDTTERNTLAISMDVDDVFINPVNLKYSDGSDVDLEKCIEEISKILDIDYDETIEKLSSATKNVEIASNVTLSKIETLNEWIEAQKIDSGITIEEDINRYYPYNNLASSLIGFTGTDNTGLIGLENSLNSILAGTSGKVVTTTDSVNQEIPNTDGTYIPAENGNNITLTIDVYIQSIAEKYLSQAVEDNSADGGNVIIMDPSTGDILAMATYPDYNLNEPFKITDSATKKNWDKMSSEEQSASLFKMWKNTAVENTYEPGSTFKIITAAAALEEGIVSADKTGVFSCTGSQIVGKTSIDCWRSYDPHGYQSLRAALQNSCNPAFIQLGQKIGTETLYKYYEAFGLFEDTNSNLYGESNSIFHDINEVQDLELATMSFGQRFNITPLQLITAVSAIANEGVLMQPRIIKKITNTDTGAVTTISPKEIRQVVSKETAATMMDMLESVVTDGTGQYAAVKGYSVSGKSGTSEPLEGDEESGYTASFIGMSPTDNTQVVVLVIIYNPTEGNYHGGQVAGPVVSQILGEILPHIGVTSGNVTTEETSSLKTVTLTDVRETSLSKAKETLEDAGFNVEFPEGENNKDDIVSDQVPKPGVSLTKGSTIYLYTDKNNKRKNAKVPNFKGMTAEQAINSANSVGISLVLDGSGIVISQDYSSGTNVEKGTVVKLTLQSELTGGY